MKNPITVPFQQQNNDMRVTDKYLVFLTKQNGPEIYRHLTEVYKTEGEYYFYKAPNSGFFQITTKEFKESLLYTIKIMPDLNVQFSKPRNK